MNIIDPGASKINCNDIVERELSVEDVVEMEAYEATIAETKIEPTEAAAEAGEVAGAQVVHVVPPKLVPLKRRVSGRYRNCRQYWELELRVDVDGYRPMKRFSGDFYQVSGATVSYFGSFVVHAPTLTVTSTHVTLVGLAMTTWATSYNKIQVTIARNSLFMPPAPAYIQFMTAANTKGAAYTCLFESSYMRTVDLEQDREAGVTPFNSYDTGSLPSGGSARTLTVAKAYAEAGVEMRTAGVSNTVPTAPGGTWSNAELHAAMEKHFSLWKEAPQWKVWLFQAMRHEYGPGLLGIMFDQKGKQRQGCAAFYQGISGTAPDKLRDQLYVCVHELGHCFNLFHSFHKKYMNPPMPNRLGALSWMNYPQNYPGGKSAFWNAFPFQFDSLEVIHLRHAFHNNIIFGGAPFGTGAALETEKAFYDNVEDVSGLKLELEAPESFALSEPVVTEIKLSTLNTDGKRVHKHLHPNYGFVQVAIQKPNGEIKIHEPPLEHCVEVETTIIDIDNPIYESAYIGYGKDGIYFDQPGSYKLRATYYALDGSQVVSNILNLKVQTPVSRADQSVADLLMGDEQGMLFYLLGSDAESLERGNKALDEVLNKYADHPLAFYAKLVKGWNAAREFKTITQDNQLEIRKPRYREGTKLLSAVVDATEIGKGVDNITLNMTMRYLAKTQKESGDKNAAKATMNRMVDIFRKKSIRSSIKNFIEAQAEEIKADL